MHELRQIILPVPLSPVISSGSPPSGIKQRGFQLLNRALQASLATNQQRKVIVRRALLFPVRHQARDAGVFITRKGKNRHKCLLMQEIETGRAVLDFAESTPCATSAEVQVMAGGIGASILKRCAR